MTMKFPGETEITINGEKHKLRLTLGALAEMEEALGGDFASLSERLKSPRVADLLIVLHALLVGGGAKLTLELLKASDVDFAAAAEAIGKAFRAFDPENMRASPKKTEAARCPGASGSPRASSS
ncbi:MAG TPA: gene transfer agent family protein [Parvularculaceae bacterium]|nr:gene transfer agent family protein [Parvularculaceae bacterium]